MCALLSTLDKKILGFEYIKNLYPCDSDFGNVFNTCEKVAFGKFFRHNCFWFRENKLCVLKHSLHDLLVREAQKGDLIGYFAISKTLGVLQEHFIGLI